MSSKWQTAGLRLAVVLGALPAVASAMNYRNGSSDMAIFMLVLALVIVGACAGLGWVASAFE